MYFNYKAQATGNGGESFVWESVTCIWDLTSREKC